jgi:hypothetical protein
MAAGSSCKFSPTAQGERFASCPLSPHLRIRCPATSPQRADRTVAAGYRPQVAALQRFCWCGARFGAYESSPRTEICSTRLHMAIVNGVDEPIRRRRGLIRRQCVPTERSEVQSISQSRRSRGSETESYETGLWTGVPPLRVGPSAVGFHSRIKPSFSRPVNPKWSGDAVRCRCDASVSRRVSRSSSIFSRRSLLFGPGRFGRMRMSRWRRWSSSHPCGRAIRRSGRRAHRGGGRSGC